MGSVFHFERHAAGPAPPEQDDRSRALVPVLLELLDEDPTRLYAVASLLALVGTAPELGELASPAADDPSPDLVRLTAQLLDPPELLLHRVRLVEIL